MENESKEPKVEEIDQNVIKSAIRGESARSARKKHRVTIRSTIFSAMLSALGIVILWLGYASGIADLTSVAIAASLTVIAQIELGSPWKWLVGAATSVLALILLPNPLLAIIYICFGGLYPLIKFEIQKAGFAVGWILKLVYFNLLLTGILALANFVFMLPSDEYGFSVLIYLLGNLTFICGDFFLSSIVVFYARKIRPKLGRLLGR